MDTTSNSADAAGDNSISDSFLTTPSGQFLVEGKFLKIHYDYTVHTTT